MHADLERILDDIRHEGPRRFAGWNAPLVEALAQGPVRSLYRRLDGQADRVQVVSAYLRLLQQAVGLGMVRQAANDSAPWHSFLERCLVEQVPALLPGVAAAQRLPLLVTVWNLGEGLLREPVWLDRYVNACAAGLDDLADVEGFLVRTLEPVLAAAPPASWQGPFLVTILDLRPLQDEFLPGDMTLAAPTVLCVKDRRRQSVEIGVLLRPQRGSEPLGLTAGLGEYLETGDRPSVEFADGRGNVAGHAVELPFLRRCHRHVIARAGFVAACAVDSQRLWIVESV